MSSSPDSTAAQDWRALAQLAPQGERLLCVGASAAQVRAAYASAWGEVIRDEDRPAVKMISLQRWVGQFWAGQWEHQAYLTVPTTKAGKLPEGEEIESDAEVEAALAAALAGKPVDLPVDAETEAVPAPDLPSAEGSETAPETEATPAAKASKSRAKSKAKTTPSEPTPASA